MPDFISSAMSDFSGLDDSVSTLYVLSGSFRARMATYGILAIEESS